MTDAWMPWALVAAALAAVVLYRKPWRFATVVFANEREEKLTAEVTRIAGCSPAQALAAVRREVRFAPNQSDETLIKRAVYHYQEEFPEGSGLFYQDPSPG